MSPSLRVPLMIATVLLSAGCATEYAVDPAGHRCDVGDVCPSGFVCVGGLCQSPSAEGLCAQVSCNSPPAAHCVDAQTVRTFARAGACDASTGSCTYAATDRACEQGCDSGRCLGQPCGGASCDAPPQTACLDAQTLRTYAQSGTCDATTDQCTYVPTDVTCTNGCEQGVCKDQDLCQNVVCDVPPAGHCDGNTAKSWVAPGTCNPGTGQCTWQSASTECPALCAAGVCVAAPKTFNQVGPRVRSQVTAIDVAPFSSGAHVLAVGPRGHASRWDGTKWKLVPSGTTNDLTAVWLRSATAGYVVGEGGVALKYDGASLSPLLMLPPPSGKLVSVHGNGLHVLIAAEDGTSWRSTDGVTFTQAPLPPSNHAYKMVQAYVDAGDRERISGTCLSGAYANPCLLFANNAHSTNWYVDPSSPITTGATSFGAVGPSVDPVVAWVAHGRSVLKHDPNSGELTTVSAGTNLQGAAISGFTSDVGAALPSVFVLLSKDANNAGALYRYTKGGGLTELMRTYLGQPVMSRNDSGGVMVADSGPTGANIHRRGALTDELLDLGEDLVAVAATSNGGKVLMNAYGDLAVLDASKPAYDLRRSPVVSPDFRGLVARTGYLLLHGRNGQVLRWTPPNTYASVSGGASTDFLAACANLDTEVFLVGTGGKVYLFDGASLVAKASGTSHALTDVLCTGAGEAFAVGEAGTVLRYSNGVWTPMGPAVPGAPVLTAVWASPQGELFVAGDGVLFRYEGGAWKSLSGKSGVTQLFGSAATELYAVSGTDVARFDGSGWSTVFTAPGVLVGGVSAQGKLTLVGSGGLIVESN